MKKILKTVGGILFLAGFLFLVWGFDNMAAAFQKPIDIYENDLKKVPRYAAVDTEIDWLYDCVGTVTTKTTYESGASYKDTNYYYLSPFEVGEKEYYVVIEVSEKNRKTYDRIVDSTWDFLDGKKSELSAAQRFTGVISRVDDRIYSYMREYFEEVYDEEEIDEYVLPYKLTSSDLERNKRLAMFSLIALILGSVIFGVGFIGKGKKLPDVPAEKLGYILEELKINKMKVMMQSGTRLLLSALFFLVDLAGKKNELLSVPVFLELLFIVLFTLWPFFSHAKDSVVLYQNGISVNGEAFLISAAGNIRFRGTSNNGLFRRKYMDTDLKTFDITLFPELEGKYYARFVKSVL